ncbi:putative cytochrome P450, partial [Ixodes scapularis]
LVKTNGLPIVTLKQFTPSASNVISRVLFGERDASTSPRGMAMVENLDKFSKALGAGSLIEVLPQWARHLVLLLPFTRSVALRRFVQNLIELGSQYVTDHEDAKKSHPANEDFVGAYLKRSEEQQNRSESNLN